MSKKLFAGNGNPPPKDPKKKEYPDEFETDTGNGEPPPKG